ncbi:tail fiber domain-containing protein [Xanthomarina sp. F2636L]|uniref:tail fiber domain-containing protein n=1 Tax=Xanthomarina sp. F2636L TaxID=2996018 RepID=UPI00225E3665|nr:tail fiber domain-containing protein [Xanthomarina sp. F2636L]MCX7551850.1 tail fiber domain-containing protein [Xanthomarina sp. F2636L]
MKTHITLLLAVLLSTICLAQNGINYKAIIKDNSGNVVANDLISVQFTILQGVAQTNVYQENHTPTTDANGLIIINIGEGTPVSGTFATIDWASDTTFLNTKVNTGTGLVDMGTTEFKTVPYAKNAETAKNVTGLEALNEGNGIGWRLIGKDPNSYGDVGFQAVDISFAGGTNSILGATGISSVAMGRNVVASGDFSITMGYNTVASANHTIAMGYNTVASAEYATTMGYYSSATEEYATAMGYFTLASNYASTAMGNETVASGQSSTAMGYNTEALGSNSIAMGSYTRASSYNALAVGRYNVSLGNPLSWIETDPVFEVGFGTSNANRLNALTVLKNGKVGIGTHTPTTFLQVTNGYNATLSDGTGYFLIGRETGTNMVFDNNEIMARNNGATSTLYLQHSGGDVRVGGVLVHSSDRRLKKDITPLSYGLETILKLNPVAYHWNNRNQDHKSLGLIAQEVQPVISEVVSVADDDAKTLGVSYTELIPVLINAVKELKAENDALKSRIEALENTKK